MRMIDLTGQTFGRWVVVKRGPNTPTGQATWNVQCECGTRGNVRSVVLRDGRSQSCGCRKLEILLANSTKHGHAANGISPTYHSWASMIARCTNPSNKRFAIYGGRGITVCKRWMNFRNFLADMGERPKGLSIDRIDNNSGYRPGNCRWTTSVTQARNRRPARR